MTPRNFSAAMAEYKTAPQLAACVAHGSFPVISIIGQRVGRGCCSLTPERVFMAASVLIAWPRCCSRSRAAQALDASPQRRPALHTRAQAIGLVLCRVAIYIAISVRPRRHALAILSLGDHGDFRTVNALKNLIGGAMGIVAAVIFIVSGLVIGRTRS
jgi:hypothetical protein